MGKYDKIEIQHICLNICSGGTPKSTVTEYYGGNIPWLNTKEINFCRIYETERTITDEGLNNSSAKWVPANTVIVAMYGATAGKTAIAKIPLTTNQACCNLNIDSAIADYRFVYYALYNNYAYLASLANGGAQQNLNAQQIKEFEIPFPPLKEQKRIADILSSLDDKIELNRRINGNLEQQAQALFKAWFVDFEPFDKNTNGIPYNWEKISLSDIMDYSGGSQPPASEFINTYQDGYIRFIQIRDYASNSHITYIPISPRNKLCQKEDIMIARYGASLGRICYGLEGAYNVALAKVIPKRPYYREFLRCYLSCNDFYEGINKKGSRAVQAGFNQSDINSFELWFPKDNSILERFEEICRNLFKARMYNNKENERLSKLRDTLLPRLMSGELNVNTITE